jgi:hypothetical protein
LKKALEISLYYFFCNWLFERIKFNQKKKNIFYVLISWFKWESLKIESILDKGKIRKCIVSAEFSEKVYLEFLNGIGKLCNDWGWKYKHW